MPGLQIPARRRRTVDEDDDDDDMDASGGSTTPASSRMVSNGYKRQRIQDDASEDGVDGEEEDESDQVDGTESPSPQPRQNDAEIGEDEYRLEKHQPGSIVRVKLTNFVTYTAAEFHPGPSLNMIIGPNGTGKSTLVCAICLGLGWSPQHLGRAKETSEFVKHGEREAEIEIELAAGPKDRRNPVIKRRIIRANNKSQYFINGESTSGKAVKSLAQKFAIQIDNLCQFLPQDRVVEFAALSPVDLLTATQRAAGRPQMAEWHEELKKFRADQKKHQAEQAIAQDTLKNLQARQESQRADVERLRERGVLQHKLATLEKCRPLPEAYQAKARYEELNERKKKARNELNDLEREVEPALQAVNLKQEYKDLVERAYKQRQRLVDHGEKRATELKGKYNDMTAKIRECENQIEAEKAGERKKREDVPRLTQQITQLQKQKDDPPVELDLAAYREKDREFTRQMREYEDKARDINGQRDGIRTNLAEKVQRVKGAQNELNLLRSQAGQRERRLQQANANVAEAWKWIQQNQEKFKERVFGPALVECSIKDPRFANQVESLIQQADVLAFTVTNRDDFRLLQDQLMDKMRLNNVNIRNIRMGLEDFRPPISDQERERLGFAGWAIDYLDGPKEVLAMLCDGARLHQSAISQRNMSDAEYQAVVQSRIQTWATPRSFYKITRRAEYNASSTQVKEVRPARFWTDQPVDRRQEQELLDNITGWQGEVDEMKGQEQSFVQQLHRNKELYGQLKQEQKELADEKAAKQKAIAEHAGLDSKLNVCKKRLADLQASAAQTRERISTIENKALQIASDRATLALEYALAVNQLKDFHTDLFQAEIIRIEAVSEVEILAARNAEVREQLAARQREVQQIEGETQQARNEAKRLFTVANQLLASMTAEEKEIKDSLPAGISVDELEAEIESARARLEMTHGGNPAAIEQYETRAKQIERQEEKLAGVEEVSRTLGEQIAEIRTQWEPELDEMVAKISDAFSFNFSKIGCAGQVSVHKDEDFDQWAIQIQVKFRETENLSILDSHRQSGGERAVSTIFYLMALQALAKAPFRVVDEINQGMDPRNERMVHERMVDIACKEHTSQYFLITPKLLSGLKYHPRMKVHCIASGEWMPENYKDLDFKELVKVAMKVRGLRRRASVL